MSCTDIRLQIDRQPLVSDSDSDHELEQVRAHTRSCARCADYLDRAEQVEQMLQNLSEIEPSSDLCLRVMKQLNEQVPEQAPEPDPRPGIVSPLLRQLLKNLSVLLACAGLLAGSGADLSAYLSPRIIGLSAMASGETAILLAIACLLLLLSIKAGPRRAQIRNQAQEVSQCT